MKKAYVFLGLPASGKGTQAQIFAKKHDLITISMGELCRERMRLNLDDEMSKRLKSQYEAGQTVDDDIIGALIKERVANIDTGIVLDNFPFSPDQLRFFRETFTKEAGWDTPELIYIKIDPASAVERITKRRVCPNCKKIFKDAIENCDECGTKLETRPDDNEETVKNRIGVYQPKIDEMISSFKEVGPIHEINGELSIPEVTAEIDKI